MNLLVMGATTSVIVLIVFVAVTIIYQSFKAYSRLRRRFPSDGRPSDED